MLDFVIQFFAAFLLLTGLWLMGNKRLLGPFLCFLAEGFTTAAGLSHHVWSIVVIGSVLFVIQGRNFWKWRSEDASW